LKVTEILLRVRRKKKECVMEFRVSVGFYFERRTQIRSVSKQIEPVLWKIFGTKRGEGAGISQSVQRLGYGLDGRRSVPGGSFYLRHSVQTASGAHIASCPIGTGGGEGSYSGGKSDHSPPSSAEIKNA
jgi:hypothetical protein